jgi:hypothetical protein
MADAEQVTQPNPLSTVTDPKLVAQWIMSNQGKKGTPEFTAVGEHLKFLTGQTAPVVTPAPTEDIGFIEGIGEAFTGSRRRTPETEAAESYQFMPEFNSMDTLLPTAKVAVGTMMGTPDEMTQVITTQFPDITARKDEKGNNFLTSPTDGQEYVIKPGMELSDIPRGLSSAALFALLKGRGLLRASGEAMVVQAGYEGTQAQLGGDFNTLDVAMAGGLPLAFAALAAPIKLAYRNTIGRLMNRNTPPSTVTTATLLSDEELVDVARRAAANDAEAVQLLAEMSAPDEKVLEAARRLGIDEFLQPDHYTTDQGFRELAQIAKSVKPSKVGAAETEGLIKVGQRSFDLIEELGGIVDLSRLNQQVRTRMKTTLDDLKVVEDKQWDALRAHVGPANRFNPRNILAYLENEIKEVGGNPDKLSILEKYVYDLLKPVENFGKIGGSSEKILLSLDDPTFNLIERVRRTVGLAARSRGELGATTDEGIAKQLYKFLDEDVRDIAYSVGRPSRIEPNILAMEPITDGQVLYDVAKATTRTIIGFEKDTISLFGKEVADSMVGALMTVFGKGYESLTAGNADNFVRLINNVPEELRESVVASGLQGAFGRATLNGALNFNSYAKWYDGLLRNRVAMNTMFKYLPNGARKQLSDLYRVAKAVNLSTVQAVRTGRPIQNALEGDTLLGKFYSVGKRAAVGLPLEAAAMQFGLGGSGIAAGVTAAILGGRGLKSSTMKALDEVMTSPQFINAAANAGTAQEQATIRALAASRPFINFLKSVNIPPSEGEQFIRSAFQSVRAGASDVSPTAPVVEEDVVIPPQASVSREMLRKTLAPSTRGGISGLGEPANEVAAAPAMAPPPSAVAQGQGPSESRQMMQRLFPFDMA